jgi:uncharacterized protein with PQ loop repeat
MDITEYFAFVGAIITAIAYIPQIAHLVRKHCAFGISIRAWVCWLIAALLIFPHAWVMKSVVFIALQLIWVSSIPTRPHGQFLRLP